MQPHPKRPTGKHLIAYHSLEKALSKLGFVVSNKDIEDIVNAVPMAIEKLLNNLKSKVYSK